MRTSLNQSEGLWVMCFTETLSLFLTVGPEWNGVKGELRMFVFCWCFWLQGWFLLDSCLSWRGYLRAKTHKHINIRRNSLLVRHIMGIEEKWAFVAAGVSDTALSRLPTKPPLREVPQAGCRTELCGDEQRVNHTCFSDACLLQTSPPPFSSPRLSPLSCPPGD